VAVTASGLTRRPSAFAALLPVLCAGFLLTCAAPPAAASTDYRGVQLHSLWSGSDMGRELDMARELGSNVVAVDVGWATLEQSGKGRINSTYVARLDSFVAGARSRGMEVIVGLWSTPCWASSAPEDLKQGCSGSWWDRGVNKYPPRDTRDFADIVRWLTARYGDDLLALEIWNEPNLDQFWLAPDKARITRRC
jgi:hypothetical protein